MNDKRVYNSYTAPPRECCFRQNESQRSSPHRSGREGLPSQFASGCCQAFSTRNTSQSAQACEHAVHPSSIRYQSFARDDIVTVIMRHAFIRCWYILAHKIDRLLAGTSPTCHAFASVFFSTCGAGEGAPCLRLPSSVPTNTFDDHHNHRPITPS
ncbi:hypothetical protein T440DRAFT_318282 [Plenodomus tracheiphilus IPT5]|uniref:Uncharacterized protein n=1 Tax=Plenodomus tracheiphilus IPT5 TaxID=1408161 RepID=A0A6A7BEG0_9PLEO|nr:hypothetical protein T440DRAFT_318282 [Plenodomus tracheiphilus IPT5]